MAANLIDSYGTEHAVGNYYAGTDYLGVGQSFTVGDGCILNSAKFHLMKTGSPTGSIYAKIYTHSGTFGTSSLPSGTALAVSDAIDVSTLNGGSLTLQEFVFSGADKIALSKSTYYVVTVEYSGGDGDNYVRYSVDTSPEADGNSCTEEGGEGSWVARPANAVIFYVYKDDDLILADSMTVKATASGIEFLGETAYKKRKFGTFLFGEKTFGAGIDFNYPFPISEDLAKKVVLNLTDEITFAEALAKGVVVPQTESVTIASIVANLASLGVSDEVGMTEGLVIENVFEKALSDVISIAEAEAEAVGRPLADTHTIADGISKMGVGIVKSDVIAITESSASINEVKRSLSDVVALADAETGILAMVLSDAILFEESLAKSVEFPLTDARSISEGLTTSKGFERSLSDVITITDAEIEATNLVLADAHSLADTISKFVVSIVRGDTMSVGEGLVTVSEFKLSLSDTISIADAEVEGVVLVLADTQVLVDEISKFGVVVGKSDVLAIAEGLVAEGGFKKSLSDSISLVDAEIEEIVKILADSISISEDLTIVRTINLALGDEIAFVEGIVAVNEFYKGLADVIAIADSEVEGVVLVLADSQSISEGLARTNEFKRSLSDSVNLADVEVEAIGITLADAISITEGLIAEKITVSELGDSISITESNVKKYVLNLSDVIAISDGTGKDVTTLLADSISFSESLELLRGRPLSDSIAITEDLAFGVVKGLADSLSIAEGITTADVAISKIENVILEGSITSKEIVVGLTDSVSIAESEEIQEDLGANLSDSLAISESIVIKITANKTEVFDLFEELSKSVTLPFTESVAVAESIGNATTLSLSDSIAFAEGLVTTGSFPLSDSIAISESLTHTLVKILSDEVSFSEDLTIDIVKPFTEAVSIVETVGNSTTLSHSDSIAISENSARVNVFERSLTDSISISEGKVKAIVKALTDKITFSDAEVEKKVNHLSDSVTAIEEISSRVIVKSITDTISIADSEVEAINLVLADSISISESLAFGAFEEVLSDSVAISESLVLDIGVPKTETLAIAETLANQTTLSLSDSISIAESEIEDVGVPSLTDSISIAETVAKAITKDFTESINITDSEIESYVLNLSDSISIAESFTVGKALGLSDSQSIVEALAKGVVLPVTDSIAISESLAKAVEFYLGLSDSITIADSTLVPSGKLILSDGMSIAESSTRSPVKTFTETVSILEVFATDSATIERLGQKAFLRIKDVNRYRIASMRQKYQ